MSEVVVNSPGTLMVENLFAGYGGSDIVRDVSFSVPAGSSLCIVGPNGAGKSTLLLTLSGVIRPRQGHISLDGRELTGLTPGQVVEAGMVQVPQERSIFPDMSVRQNVELGGYLLRSRAAVKARYGEVLAQFPGLQAKEKAMAGTLSGGQRKLLEFARCLMLRPKVVVLDEPSQGLDPATRRIVFESITSMSSSGQTIVLVEQNARAGLSLSDRGLVLVAGQVVLTGLASDVVNDPEIAALYLGGRGSATRARRSSADFGR